LDALKNEKVDFEGMTGEKLYERAGGPATDRGAGHPQSTAKLRDMGIAGIRYLDAKSRMAGGGIGTSSNLVTFDSPRILSRFTPPKPGEPPAPAKLGSAEVPFASAYPDNKVVNVDASKFDKGWQRDQGMYVGKGGEGGIDGRYDRAQKFFQSGPKKFDAPEASVNDQGGITFVDGRHRYAAMRDAGHEQLPMAMSPESIANARKHGYLAEEPAAPAIVGNRSKFVDPDTGLPIGGPGYTKEAQAINRDIAQGPKGAGPMDLSTQHETPDVLQMPMDRYVPPRGISGRMQDALQSENVRSGLEESMKAGAGVRDWYHTEPIRQEFLKTIGPDQGEDAFKKYMDYVAATSPRSDVPTNIRNASYYYAGGDPTKTNPYPYGHIAQKLHKQNVTNLDENGGWDAMQNPKPASFAENLRGNLEPVTVDTHAFRNIGMRTGDPRFLETSLSNIYKKGSDPAADTMAGKYGELQDTPKGTVVTYRPQQLVKEGKMTMAEAQKIPSFWTAKPKDNEYAAAENLYKEVGNRVGMRPADAQAAAWAGAGDMTGLGTVGTHTFPELMNERLLFTAKMRGEDPHKVLADFVSGKKPLLSLGGAAAVGGGAAALAGSSNDAQAMDLAGLRRSPNVEDRRGQVVDPKTLPPANDDHFDPADLSNGRYPPPSTLNRALGGSDLDRGIALRLLKSAMEDKQLMETMRSSQPSRKRTGARADFGSLDGR
jgi:hypothetical protein